MKNMNLDSCIANLLSPVAFSKAEIYLSVHILTLQEVAEEHVNPAQGSLNEISIVTFKALVKGVDVVK